MSHHFSEDDLTLYYYGEGRRPDVIEHHLESCPRCASLYRDIAGTLAMIAAPEVPERGEQYGLEVWQRIRHKLPERETGLSGLPRFWGFSGLGLAAAAALLMIAAFVGGRAWQRSETQSLARAVSNDTVPPSGRPASPASVEHPESSRSEEHTSELQSLV